MRTQPLAILCVAAIVVCGNAYLWHEIRPTWNDITSNILADPPDVEMGALFAGAMSMIPMAGIGLTPAPRHKTHYMFLAGCWFTGATLLLGMVFVIADTVGYTMFLWPTAAGLGGTAVMAAANGVRQIRIPRLAA